MPSPYNEEELVREVTERVMGKLDERAISNILRNASPFYQFVDPKESAERTGIKVILKDGRVKPLEEFDISDVTYNIYDFWEYAGMTNPLGQAAATIINAITSALKPLIQGVSGVVNTILSDVQSLLNNVQNIGNIVNSISSAIGSIGNTISQIINTIEQIPQGVANALSGLLTDISNAISGVKDAIQGIVNQIEQIPSQIENAISGITSSISSIVSGITNTIQSFFSQIQNAIEGIQSAIGNIVSQITNTISGIVTQIENGFSAVTNTIQSIVGGITNTIENAFSSIQNVIGGIVNRIEQLSGDITNAIQGIATKIGGIIQQIVSKVEVGFNEVRNALGGLAEKIINGIKGFITGIENLLKDLATRIKSGFNAIKTVFGNIIHQIQTSIQGLAKDIGKIVTSIKNTLGGITKKIVTTIQDLPQTVNKLISPILDKFRTYFASIMDGVSSIATAFKGFINPLVEIKNWLQNRLYNLFKDLYDNVLKPIYNDVASIIANPLKALKGALTDIADFFKNVKQKAEQLFSPIVNAIKNFLHDPLKAIHDALKPLANIVSDLVNKAEKLFAPVVDAIKKFIHDPLGAIKEALAPLANLVDDLVQKAEQLFAPVKTAIEDFIKNPLGAIHKALQPVEDLFSELKKGTEKFFAPITSAIGSLLDHFKKTNVEKYFESLVPHVESAAEDVYTWLKEGVHDVLTFAESVGMGIISTIAGWMFSAIEGFTNIVSNVLGKAVGGLISGISAACKTIYIDPLIAVFGIEKWVKENEDVLRKSLFQSPTNKAQQEFQMFLLTVLLGNLPAELLATYWLTTCADSISGIVGKIRAKVSAVLASLGITVDSKTFKKGFTGLLKLIGKELLKTILFTTAFWIYEPYKYYVNPFVRWNLGLPHEIPTYPEILKTTRRFLPCKLLGEGGNQNYKKMYETMVAELHKIMDYRAYPFWFEVLTLGSDTPQEVLKRADIPNVFWFEVQDRFNFKRKIPMLALYELPTPSDTIRMMMRDVIINLDQFELLMASHGFNRDVTSLYYLLHFKYPSPTNLFDFAMRIAGGIAWFNASGKAKEFIERNVKQFTEWKLGFKPKTPVDLTKMVENIKLPEPSQNTTEIDTSAIDQAISGRFNEVVGYILPYYKWHNYFPMSWMEGWTSDQQMAIELSAEIPQRIDARWMFKWCLITDTDLLRIVMARGMHPQWAAKIAIAEAINSMGEERNYARTGVMNAFKYGVLTENDLQNILSHLCDVSILGVTVPIKFLPGEVELLKIRANYDRALELIRYTVREATYAYAENLITMSDFTGTIQGVIQAVNKSLGLNLTMDESYFASYEPYLNLYHTMDTYRRIRSWIRYSLYQLMYRFMRGFVPKSVTQELLNELVEAGKLTESEKQIFETMMNFMASGYVSEVEVRAILRELERGAITLDDAKKRLMNLGMSEELADALIEAYARHYTLSISTLLSYADYVEIPEEVLKQKMQILGVPESDQEIILKVFRIKPVASEMYDALRELLEAYSYGYITEKELDKAIQEYGISRVGLKYLKLAYAIRKQINDAKLAIEALIHKFKRGAIDLKTLRKKLIEIVHDETTADLIIEKNARVYEMSVDKLVELREYVPIPIEKIVQTAEEFGYPEDEVKVLPAYTVARELSSEILRVANELGEDFVYGVLTEQEFKKALDELATLNGQVKKKLGVDWIVLSPEERELLVALYKLRKQRHIAEEASRRRR